MSDFKGVWIPAKLMQCKNLTIMEKLFLTQIYSLDNDGGCTAGNAYFSELFVLTKSRCSQIIKSLEDKKMIEVTIKRDGKLITQRVCKILNLGIKYFKEGIKNTKFGYLENAKDNNTEDNNTKEKESTRAQEITEPLTPLKELELILKGDLIMQTELDKNFNFGLFGKEWSENFKNEVITYFRYMESKKGSKWGIIGTLTSQLDVLKSYLNEFSENEIIEALKETKLNGNVSYNPKWTMNRKKAEENNKKPFQKNNSIPAYSFSTKTTNA